MSVASREDAQALDAVDPLRSARALFDLPAGIVYLDGNSLGPAPKASLERLQKTAYTEWRRGLVTSWNDAGWIDLPGTCGAKIARLLGAGENEVIVADSVSANLFKLSCALAEKTDGAVAYEDGEFPTDGYIVQGLCRFAQKPILRLAPEDPAPLSDIGVLIKSLVHYKTAAVADMTAWEEKAARENVSIIWDLSHAAGVLDIDLKSAGARYAVGCGYKFLNGGPGAPAFLYVDDACAGSLFQPLSGWMGHATPFAFGDAYKPAPGVQRFACGTPPILSLSALDAALDIFADLDMRRVETKAKALGDLLLARAAALGLETVSPPPGERRGGHVSFKLDHGFEVVQALIARNVVGDFRTPDLMRFGVSPLFLRYADVWDAADGLADILKTQAWRKPEYAKRRKVT